MNENILFGNILRSENITLIAISPISSDFNNVDDGRICVASFVDELHSRAVPLVACFESKDKLGPDRMTKIAGLSSVIRCFYTGSANPCLDASFRESVAKLDRKFLILMSDRIEGRLTIVGLSLLELGYDLAVLVDIAAKPLSDSDRFALDRLIQAGVVPLTMKQVLLELKSH